MSDEILWCLTHESKASSFTVGLAKAPAICEAGYRGWRQEGAVPECAVVRRLLVDPDAPSVVISNDGFSGRMPPAGVYVLVKEA